MSQFNAFLSNLHSRHLVTNEAHVSSSILKLGHQTLNICIYLLLIFILIILIALLLVYCSCSLVMVILCNKRLAVLWVKEFSCLVSIFGYWEYWLGCWVPRLRLDRNNL